MKKKYQTKPKKMAISAPKKSEYEKDFYKWICSQTELLKLHKLEKLDIENIMEEIESLGKAQKNAIESHLVILLLHLLKTEHQSEMDCNSWKASIRNSTLSIKRILKDSPSLKSFAEESLPDAYEDAKKYAAAETELTLETFPKKCPWKLDELIDGLDKKKGR